MPDFSEVVAELTGSGYTESEALLATVALSKVPQIDSLLESPLATEYMVHILLDGYTPENDLQRALVRGVDSFSPSEKRRYLLHAVEGVSMGEISKQDGVSKGAVQGSIERARKKLKLAAGGR